MSGNNLSPIFIPSKGRPNPKTAKIFRNSILVIEPQDELEYKQKAYYHSQKYLILPENDKGIAFSRNAILKYCYAKGIDWAWMMDDDITGFHENISGKNTKIELNNIEHKLYIAQEKIKGVPEIGVGALNFAMHCWGTKVAKYSFGSSAVICVLLNIKAIFGKGLRYRSFAPLHDDIDFIMQVIKSGLMTVKLNHIGFAVPELGTVAGGLFPIYAKKDSKKKSCELMIKKWGKELCPPNLAYYKRSGKYAVLPKWNKLMSLSQLKLKKYLQKNYK